MDELDDDVRKPSLRGRGELRVLFVGKADGASTWLRALLGAYGHASTTAPDAASGLAAISAVAADVVVIDVEWPASGGNETARRIRMAFGGDVRLIALVAHRGAGEVAAAREPFDAVFARPFHAGALIADLDAYRAAAID